MIIRIVFAVAAVLLIDVLLLLLIRGTFRPGSHSRRILFRLVWISAGLFAAFTFAIFLITGDPGPDIVKYRLYFLVTTGFLIIYLPKLLMILFFSLAWLINLIHHRRSTRFSNLLGYTGIVIAALIFLGVLHGFFYGKSNFKIKEMVIESRKLPASFDGLRVVHFSDAHLGSFSNPAEVRKGLEMIRKANPDILIFSGDLINVAAEETTPYISDFASLQARLGKFAILGNHDMEDYARWDTVNMRPDNPAMLEKAYGKMGFRLMRNEQQWIIQGDDSILVAGIDNWGLPPFKKHGDLRKALGPFMEATQFTILISHDPSHWRAEILPLTDVDLTLSGHTHGLQMGIRTSFWSWSPSSWMYPEWVGLYSEGQQKLYVNPGFGFLGFVGRIGIYPEITVFTLRKI